MEVFNNDPNGNEPQINFIQEGIKIGLINGSFALLIMYGSYFAGLNTFVNVQFMSAFIPYMIIILIIYGLQLRKRNGNYLAFKDSLQFTFLSYVIAAVMVAIGTYVLYNLIDKDLTQKSFDLTVEKTMRTLERLKVDQKDIDEELGSLDKKETTIRTIILGMGMFLIWDFVKSLLISLIIRREKTVF